MAELGGSGRAERSRGRRRGERRARRRKGRGEEEEARRERKVENKPMAIDRREGEGRGGEGRVTSIVYLLLEWRF